MPLIQHPTAFELTTDEQAVITKYADLASAHARAEAQGKLSVNPLLQVDRILEQFTLQAQDANDGRMQETFQRGRKALREREAALRVRADEQLAELTSGRRDPLWPDDLEAYAADLAIWGGFIEVAEGLDFQAADALVQALGIERDESLGESVRRLRAADGLWEYRTDIFDPTGLKESYLPTIIPEIDLSASYKTGNESAVISSLTKKPYQEGISMMLRVTRSGQINIYKSPSLPSL